MTDCLFIVGHNIAATQTVLWSRMLDRLHGPNPPRCVVVDPRRTPTAELATVHLQPAAGTNLALLNGMQRLMFERGYIDEEYVKKHTIGVEQLKRIIEGYTPERVHEITGVPPDLLSQAVDVIGTSKTVLATALQGVYQSNQATASACQINNIQLLRGNIGKPGGGIYQVSAGDEAVPGYNTDVDGMLDEWSTYRPEQPRSWVRRRIPWFQEQQQPSTHGRVGSVACTTTKLRQ